MHPLNCFPKTEIHSSFNSLFMFISFRDLNETFESTVTTPCIVSINIKQHSDALCILKRSAFVLFHALERVAGMPSHSLRTKIHT